MPLAYVTLYQLRAELGLGADQLGDDALLRRHLRAGGRWIDHQLGVRHCDPRRQSRRFDGNYHQVLLDDDLQAVVSVTNGDSTSVASSAYYLESPGRPPYWALTLKEFADVAWAPDASGSYRLCLAIDGQWYYHTDPANAWADTLDTVGDNPLLVAGTALHVTDADGAAADSSEPRFQVDNLVRFGSSDSAEFALVIAVDTVTNIVTLQRGVGGTTAAAQSMGTHLYVFRPEETVQRALMRIATFTYRGKDGKPTERISVLGNTQQVVPGGIPADVLDLLPQPLVVR
jgi:hypothetical protein